MIMESKMNDSSGFGSPMDGPSGYPDLPTPDAGDVPF